VVFYSFQEFQLRLESSPTCFKDKNFVPEILFGVAVFMAGRDDLFSESSRRRSTVSQGTSTWCGVQTKETWDAVGYSLDTAIDEAQDCEDQLR